MTLQFEILYSHGTVPFASLDLTFSPRKSTMCECYTSFITGTRVLLGQMLRRENLSPPLFLHFPSLLHTLRSRFHSPRFVPELGDAADIVSVTSVSLPEAKGKSHSRRTARSVASQGPGISWHACCEPTCTGSP